MRTLFSPIGTADPLTQQGDGPMLHIVRHYMPERVVLFLSPKMRDFQQSDGRYTEAIERLCASEGRPLPSIELVESSFEEVFRFDHYIEEFEGILTGLCEQSPDEPVLVNTSSGTPGWQQALVTLGSFGRLRLTLLQVTTPRRGINSRNDRENPNAYDLDTLWELNEELRQEDPDACKSRIIEVKTPNFADRLIRENVATLVGDYEYGAAYELACASQGIDDATKRVILAAANRLNLDGTLPAQVFAKSSLAYRPNDLLGEYLSVMQVRLLQRHWADFVRMLTPALTRLYKDTLQKNGLPEQAYMQVERGRLTDKLDWIKIEEDARLREAFRKLSSSKPVFITNGALEDLVEEYCHDETSKDMLEKLRLFERGCRNIIAHELRASSKQTLESCGGLALETVLQYLFDLHGNMRPHLYADISQAIIEQL